MEDNEGTSVTNWAEALATEISRSHRVAPNRLIWIEHYQDRGAFRAGRPQFAEHFDRVTFECDEWGKLIRPNWLRVPKSLVRSMIGESLEPAADDEGRRAWG